MNPIPNAVRLYVIGDIHGRLDLLDNVLGAIHGDIAKHPADKTLTVTLGDYIDRGPNSRGVLDRLATNPFPGDYVALKGNHEAFLEGFLRNPSAASEWRHYGGLETLHSYGIAVNQLMIGKGFDEAAEQLRATIPATHLAFLSSLRMSIEWGNYFLCHAGVRPGVALAKQRDEDLLFIREEFISSKKSFGKIVIHGHTPVEEPEVLSNRINIDTGAFATGRLTCLVIENDERRFLQTS